MSLWHAMLAVVMTHELSSIVLVLIFMLEHADGCRRSVLQRSAEFYRQCESESYSMQECNRRTEQGRVLCVTHAAIHMPPTIRGSSSSIRD